MNKSETIGSLVGSVMGAIGTGIAIYFTGSVRSSLIGLAGYLIGSSIGKEVNKTSR